MFKLQQLGIKLVPVTGACAGWCDCMVRTWPVNSSLVKMEHFLLIEIMKVVYSYFHALDESQRKHNWQQLQQLKKEIHTKFNQAKQTADQPFRLNDIAFDIDQDHKVNRKDALEIAEYCRSHGAKAKISSIHINVWQGDYSKSITALHWLKQQNINPERAILLETHQTTMICSQALILQLV